MTEQNKNKEEIERSDIIKKITDSVKDLDFLGDYEKELIIRSINRSCQKFKNKVLKDFSCYITFYYRYYLMKNRILTNRAKKINKPFYMFDYLDNRGGQNEQIFVKLNSKLKLFDKESQKKFYGEYHLLSIKDCVLFRLMNDFFTDELFSGVESLFI